MGVIETSGFFPDYNPQYQPTGRNPIELVLQSLLSHFSHFILLL
jgi:hypothetical protein